MTNKELIQKEIQDHIDTLNEKDEEGEEMFFNYRDEIDFTEDRKDETIAELVASADFDSTEFNIGFEQGYMRGLEVALSVIKEDEDYEMLARENKNMAEALSKLNYTPEQISDICNGAI